MKRSRSVISVVAMLLCWVHCYALDITVCSETPHAKLFWVGDIADKGGYYEIRCISVQRVPGWKPLSGVTDSVKIKSHEKYQYFRYKIFSPKSDERFRPARTQKLEVGRAYLMELQSFETLHGRTPTISSFDIEHHYLVNPYYPFESVYDIWTEVKNLFYNVYYSNELWGLYCMPLETINVNMNEIDEKYKYIQNGYHDYDCIRTNPPRWMRWAQINPIVIDNRSVYLPLV